jgi:hypothetical protein
MSVSQAAEQLDNTDDLTLDDIASGMDEPEEVEEEGAEESEQLDTDEDNDDAAPEVAAADDDPEFEVDHGGQRLKLKKSELVAGYMKDADYRKKTAEVAEAKRQSEAMVQAVAQERQQYVTRLDTLMQALQSELVDDQAALNELAKTDPAAYIARLQQANAKAQKYREAESARQALQEQQRQAEAKATADYAAAEHQKLIERLPSWRDAKRAGAEQKLIVEYLTSIGYQPQELSELYDHRALLVAREAALYRASKTAKQKVDKPTRTPVRPGASQRTHGREANVQKATDRLKRNPNSLDALAGFAASRGI